VDLKNEFRENDVILVISSMEKYQAALSMSLRGVDGISKKICYFSFTKDGKSLARLLEKEKIGRGKFIFLQTVSESEKTENSFYAGRIEELTKISLACASVLSKYKPDCVFNDSLSALFIYVDGNSALRFTIDLIKKTRENESKIILLASIDEKNASPIKELYMYSDKIIDLRKGAG